MKLIFNQLLGIIMLSFLKSFIFLLTITMIYGCSSGTKVTVHEFDNSLSENKDTVVVLTTYGSWDGSAKRTTLYGSGKGITEKRYTYGSNPSNKSNFQFPEESFKLLVKTFEMYDFFSLKDKYFDDTTDCPNRAVDGGSYEITFKINGRKKTVITGNCYGSAQVTKLLFLIKLVHYIESPGFL